MRTFRWVRIRRSRVKVSVGTRAEAPTPAAYRVTGAEPKEAILALLTARAHHVFFAATLARDQPQCGIIVGVTAPTVLGAHGVTVTGCGPEAVQVTLST